jgi:hypothetical protein
VLNVTAPISASARDSGPEDDSEDNWGASQQTRVQVVRSIRHETGEIHRARCHPSRPSLVATKSPSPELSIYNLESKDAGTLLCFSAISSLLTAFYFFLSMKPFSEKRASVVSRWARRWWLGTCMEPLSELSPFIWRR